MLFALGTFAPLAVASEESCPNLSMVQIWEHFCILYGVGWQGGKESIGPALPPSLPTGNLSFSSLLVSRFSLFRVHYHFFHNFLFMLSTMLLETKS